MSKGKFTGVNPIRSTVGEQRSGNKEPKAQVCFRWVLEYAPLCSSHTSPLPTGRRTASSHTLRPKRKHNRENTKHNRIMPISTQQLCSFFVEVKLIHQIIVPSNETTWNTDNKSCYFLFLFTKTAVIVDWNILFFCPQRKTCQTNLWQHSSHICKSDGLAACQLKYASIVH